MNETRMTIVQVSDLAGFEAQRRELLAAEELQLVELATGYGDRLGVAKAETEVLVGAIASINARLDEIRGTATAARTRCVKRVPDPDPEPEPAPEPVEISVADRIAALLAAYDCGLAPTEIAKGITPPPTVKKFATWRLIVQRALQAEPKRFKKTGRARGVRYHLAG